MFSVIDSLSIPAYLFGLGPTELGIILLVVLVIFGPKKLPEMGKAIGESIRELKKAGSSDNEADKEKPEATTKEAKE
jgi:sec-independent protein translocase protein TatA